MIFGGGKGMSERKDKGGGKGGNQRLLGLGGSLCLDLGDSELDIHTGLDRDGGDLLDRLGRALDVDDTLVDVHGEAIPGLGTLTARSLAGGEAEVLGGHATRTTDSETLLLGRLDEGGADLLDVGDIEGGEGHTDTLHGLLGGCSLLGRSGSRHIGNVKYKKSVEYKNDNVYEYLPCFVCPAFKECKKSNVVNPIDCPYNKVLFNLNDE